MSKPVTEKNINVPDHILKELLTPSELRMLKNRFLIISLLKQGLSIRAVAERVKVGTDTVVRVSKMLGKEGVRNYFKQSGPAGKKATSYVFGKSEE